MSEGPTFARIPARAAGLGLTATDWAVLHVICLHADKSGHAYPSLARIAQIANIRRNHVSRSTKRLEELGLLRSSRLSRGSGWANTRYDVAFDGVVAPEMGTCGGMAPDEAVLPVDGMAPQMGAPEPRVAPERVLGGTSGGTTSSTSGGTTSSTSGGTTSSTSDGTTSSTSDGALTDQITYQGTELTKQEESQIENKATGSDGTAPTPSPHRSGPTCRWYVTNDAGYRLCGKPAVAASHLCADHTTQELAA